MSLLYLTALILIISTIPLTFIIHLIKPLKNRRKNITILHHPEINLTGQPGDTLLNTLTDNNISIPSSCGGKGICKKCKIRITNGPLPPNSKESSCFSNEELENGWRLACQSTIQNDIEISLPPKTLELKEITATVMSNRNISTFAKELIVETPININYQPGCYLEIIVPPYKTNTSDWKDSMDSQFQEEWNKKDLFNKTIDNTSLDKNFKRAYSLASYPAEGHLLTFNIRIASPPEKQNDNTTPWGIASSYLFSLKQGDTIKVIGPFGDAIMKKDNTPLIFLIGGVGSSFGRSHILHLFNTEKTTRDVSYWYGARSLKDAIYHQEFQKLSLKHKNFSYHLVLSDPSQEDIKNGWDINNSTSTNYLYKAFEEGQLKNLKEPLKHKYYVCGPPLHNQKILELLDAHNIPKTAIVLDDFSSN